jgi:hypothetical protein
MVPATVALTGIRRRRRTRTTTARAKGESSLMAQKAQPNGLVVHVSERKRHRTKPVTKPRPSQAPTAAMDQDDDDTTHNSKRSKIRATVPKYQSRFWKLSQQLQTSDSLWNDDNDDMTPPSSCPYNVHVMERTLSLKLVAGFHKEALEFCHDVLICWYGEAAAAALTITTTLSSQTSGENKPDISNVRNSIAYMWCLYAQVVSRVLKCCDYSEKKRRIITIRLLLNVAMSCPLVRNHSAVVLLRVKLEMEEYKWIGDIQNHDCDTTTIQGFAKAVQQQHCGATGKDENNIIQRLSSAIIICNNAVKTFDCSFEVSNHTTNDTLRSSNGGTLGRTLQKSIIALGRTVATLWSQSSYHVIIDASSAILICNEANRLSRIKEAILNLEADDSETCNRLEEGEEDGETCNSLDCKLPETTNYPKDKSASDCLLDNSGCVAGQKGRSKCYWGVEYACRCFARFATQQELEGHTCGGGGSRRHQTVAPESQDPIMTELELLMPNVTIGSRISVYWADYDQYYDATVTSKDTTGTKKPLLYLEYDDGDCDWVDLREHTFRLIRQCFSNMEDGILVEYGCKYCPFCVFETQEKLLEHEQSACCSAHSASGVD